MTYQISQFVSQGLAAPVIIHRTNTSKGILAYVQDDIPPKLMNISYVSSDNECLAIELNVHKTKWLLICSFSPYKKITQYFDEYQGNY